MGMKGQQPVKHYIDDTGAAGRWSANVREGQGAQINTEHAGFRARKMAMHEQDAHNDKNIEDRGSEKEFEARPGNEEKENHEGVKELKGREM